MMILSTFPDAEASPADATQQQGGPHRAVEGNWMGQVSALRLTLQVITDADGAYKARLSCPERGVFDLHVDEVVFAEGALHLEIDCIQAAYGGKLIDAVTLEGEWEQGGVTHSLTFERVERVPLPPGRPQTPHRPYPYREEELVYENVRAGVKLAGTLTRDAIPDMYRDYLQTELTGDSVIIDPRGEIVAGPISGENIIIADCSMALVRSAKVAFDCAGHASRSDQLKFTNQATEGHDVSMAGSNMPGFDDSNESMNFEGDQQTQPNG